MKTQANLLPVWPSSNQHVGPTRIANAGLSPEAPTIPVTEDKQATELATPWNVIVYNDPVNLMNYVTMVIQRIFGYPENKARMMMLDVHQRGLCVVWTGEKEKAEHYVRELQSFQLLAAMKKSSD
jgi:ATP-dependent Clp protease adaptor protein ClpS